MNCCRPINAVDFTHRQKDSPNDFLPFFDRSKDNRYRQKEEKQKIGVEANPSQKRSDGYNIEGKRAKNFIACKSILSNLNLQDKFINQIILIDHNQQLLRDTEDID